MRPRVTARNRPEPLEDEDLQQLITDRIEEDPVFWTGSGRRRTYVTVEVEDGHVMLSGVVRSALDRRRADILARALGAVSVDNRLGIAEDCGQQGKGEAQRGVNRRDALDGLRRPPVGLSDPFRSIPRKLFAASPSPVVRSAPRAAPRARRCAVRAATAGRGTA